MQGALPDNIVCSDPVMLFRGSAAAAGSFTFSRHLMQPEEGAGPLTLPGLIAAILCTGKR